MTYPAWSYFPRNVRPPAWAVSFVEFVRAAGAKISTVEHKTGLSSDDVLKELGPGPVALGYAVESGKTKAAKIFRPVLFGENGATGVNYGGSFDRARSGHALTTQLSGPAQCGTFVPIGRAGLLVG